MAKYTVTAGYTNIQFHIWNWESRRPECQVLFITHWVCELEQISYPP